MKFVCQRYPKLEMTYKKEIVREVNGVIMKTPREIIKFEGGFYATDDPDRIAFIKRHTDFGNGNITISEEEKYQKKDEPEITPAPETKRRGRPKKE